VTEQSAVELSTLKRGLEILGLFQDTNARWDTTGIAKHLGLTKSTTYKYIQTLVRSGFLVREIDESTLRLGPRVLELAHSARNPSHVADLAYPILEDVVEQTNETALLAARMGSLAVCLAKVESRHSLKLSYELGYTYPLQAGGTAQVLLAWLDEGVLERILSTVEWKKYTNKTIMTAGEFRRRLASIREKGVAVSEGELDAGTFTVAAPVFDPQGAVIASLSVGGPLQRFTEEARKEYPRLIIHSADRVSSLLRRAA
jgi:DNA-binding IclR family transcriptional regulator